MKNDLFASKEDRPRMRERPLTWWQKEERPLDVVTREADGVLRGGGAQVRFHISKCGCLLGLWWGSALT